MKKDYKIIASEILENVGGETNVSNVTHCATRLRFNLVNEEKAKEENIKMLFIAIVEILKKQLIQFLTCHSSNLTLSICPFTGRHLRGEL